MTTTAEALVELQARYDRCKELEAAAQNRLAKMEAALLDLLRAPFMEWYPYAIGNGCHLLTHPDKYPEGYKPKFKPNGCPCGKRKDREEA